MTLMQVRNDSEDSTAETPSAATPDAKILHSPGVKKVELAKKVSSKWNIYSIYAGIMFVRWAYSWEGFLTQALTAPVTSVLHANHLQSILNTLSSILQSVMLPTFSKLSDLTGRVEAFTVATLIYLVSWVVHATANDYGTFVGGKILNTFGDTGIMILLPIITGDVTSITNRGFYHGVLQVPTIINMFCTSLAADGLLYTGEYPGQWRWGYGMIPIIMAVCVLPIIVGLWIPQIKFERAGMYQAYLDERKRVLGGRTWWESVSFFATELDAVGCVLLVGGLCMILLPFQLESTWGSWASSKMLGCLIGGVACWAVLIYWEMKIAKKPVLPINKWPNKTALLGVLAVSANSIGSSTNGTYLRTYLQVTRKVTAGRAAMLTIGFSVAAIALQALTGFLMMKTKLWRPYLWSGILFLILALGLMIQARQPTSSDAFLVASQVIAGVGTGLFEVPFIVAVQSSVPHDDLAMITSLYQVGQSIASSVGSTIAGAIWNQMLPQEFEKWIPGEYDARKIMSSIPYAQSLPDDQYKGLQIAYGRVQRTQTIIHLSMAILTFFLTVPMKSFGLRDRKGSNEQAAREKLDDASTTADPSGELDEKHPDRASADLSQKPSFFKRFINYLLS